MASGFSTERAIIRADILTIKHQPGQILAFTSREPLCCCCFWLGLQNEDGEHFCCLGNNVFISSCRVRNKKYLTEAREMSRHIINCINTLLVSSHNCHQTQHTLLIFAALTTHSYLLLISASYKNNILLISPRPGQH